MFCPLNPAHLLIEIAPDLWQCPKCGSGPRDGVRFPFWSLSCVEIFRHEAEGLAIKYNPESGVYVMSSLDWLLDDEGRVLTGTLVEEFLEYISTDQEKREAALPVTSRSGSGCSQELSRLMYQSPFGKKVI